MQSSFEGLVIGNYLVLFSVVFYNPTYTYKVQKTPCRIFKEFRIELN